MCTASQNHVKVCVYKLTLLIYMDTQSTYTVGNQVFEIGDIHKKVMKKGSLTDEFCSTSILHLL